jgi:glycosyltransferase involved in cell wall biosynthesis
MVAGGEGAHVRVAVVIPTHDRADMLGDALASVAAQSERCEAYVYDDGSTDDTYSVASRFDCAYLKREHGGSVTTAFNRAVEWVLSRSEAPYIAWLGSDDAYARDAVRLRADALDAQAEAGIVFSGLRFVSASRWPSRRGTDHGIDVTRYTPGDISTFSRNVLTGTALFRREAWIPWREEIRLGGADLLWVYEQVTRGLRVGYVDASLYYLRKHDGRNITRWRGTDDEVRQAERRVYRRLVREIREEHGYG